MFVRTVCAVFPHPRPRPDPPLHQCSGSEPQPASVARRPGPSTACAPLRAPSATTAGWILALLPSTQRTASLARCGERALQGDDSLLWGKPGRPRDRPGHAGLGRTVSGPRCQKRLALCIWPTSPLPAAEREPGSLGCQARHHSHLPDPGHQTAPGAHGDEHGPFA